MKFKPAIIAFFLAIIILAFVAWCGGCDADHHDLDVAFAIVMTVIGATVTSLITLALTRHPL